MKVTFDAKTNTLTITVPVNGTEIDKLPLSGTGKNRNIATTGGNQPVQLEPFGLVRVGVNVYVKA